MKENNRNLPNSERTAHLTRKASLFGLVAFALISVGFWVMFFAFSQPQNLMVGGLVFALAAAASLAAFLLQRAAKYDLANWIFLLTILAIGVVPSFIYSGTGYLAALVTLSAAIVLASYLFFDRQIMAFFALGLGSLMVALIADTFGPSNRPLMMQPAVATFISIFMAAVLVFIVVLRFGSFPFRVKIVASIFGITASAILIIAAVSVYFSSQSITREGYSNMVTAARLVAGAVDQFIGSTLADLEVQAGLPDLNALLVATSPSGPARQQAEETLQQLASQASLTSSQANPHQYLQAYLLIDQRGKVVSDTSNAQLDQDVSAAGYFQHSIQNPMPFVSPVYFSADNTAALFFSAQIQDQSGKPAGVLAARYDAAVLQQFLIHNNNLVTDQSYAILLDENGLRLAQGTISADLYKPFLAIDESLAGELRLQGRLPPGLEVSSNGEVPDLGRQLELQSGKSNLVFRAGKNSTGSYHYAAADFLQLQPWTVIYVVPQVNLLQPVVSQAHLVQILGMIVLFIALVIAYFLSRILTAPVQNMIETANAIAGGNFAARTEVKSSDEIGLLSQAVNELGIRMQTSLQNMDRQNEDRSRTVERRTHQLQTAAEIGRALSTIQNIDELLDRSVFLISQRFNFYHVGIFLIDETGRFAVLRASNSEGGKRMLARSHRLAVGQQGIVGYVTSTGRARIALDVGADAVFFNNPELPDTHSEIALPLVTSDRILGALDIQSDEPGAFTTDDFSVLQVLADFLAVTIENGRVLLESRTALEAIRHSYGELSQRSWVDRLGDVADIGFRSLDQGVFSIANAPSEPEADGAKKLSIPIRVRETLIGYVDAVKPAAKGEWTKEELDTVDALVDQLGVALESARLFENTQLLAERERLVSDFNTRLQESLDVETVLRTAVTEMRQILGSKHVTLVLGKGNDS